MSATAPHIHLVDSYGFIAAVVEALRPIVSEQGREPGAVIARARIVERAGRHLKIEIEIDRVGEGER
jgi:hypothetical protein